MDGVKLVCGCAVLMALAGQIASIPSERRQAFISTAGMFVGRHPAAAMPATARTDAAPPEPRPSLAPASFQAESIPPDNFGQFRTTVEVEGQRLPVLVDTGASFVALSFEDAGRLGLWPMPADFKYVSSTANGQVAFAKAELHEIRLGSIAVRDVVAFVAPRGALSTSLLGMSFLSKLSGFKVDEGRLLLQQ